MITKHFLSYERLFGSVSSVKLSYINFLLILFQNLAIFSIKKKQIRHNRNVCFDLQITDIMFVVYAFLGI